MDPTTLRIILAVGGGMLLAGLFLWEVRRAAPGSAGSAPRPERREPAVDPDEDWLNLGGDPPENGAIDPNPQWDLDDEPEHDEAPPPRAVLSISVAAAAGSFPGSAIVSAALRCGLEPGPDVFIREDDQTLYSAPLFSVANMVNPGTFPLGGMNDFETPGITLIAAVEDRETAARVLAAMLATARCLARELGGELRLGTRTPLTEEAEAGLWAEVRGYPGLQVA